MPKTPSFPTLYDEVKTIDVSFLKQHGYLNRYQVQRGILTWSLHGNKTGSISILVNFEGEKPYAVLDYKCNGKPINYQIQMVSIPSNLGKGNIWFFICPATAKRCRKLYLADTYFCHRAAFKGCMYEKQTESKQYRSLRKTIDAYFRVDALYNELYKKHFKKYYAGKPTKKYLRIAGKLLKAESGYSPDKSSLTKTYG